MACIPRFGTLHPGRLDRGEYEMKESYTMEEFIKEFRLGVDKGDPGATRQIAKRLRELGYARTRGMYKGENRTFWTRRAMILKVDLMAKLKEIR